VIGFIFMGLLVGALVGWYIGSSIVDRKRSEGRCGATLDWCADDIVYTFVGAVFGAGVGGGAAAVVIRPRRR
jgi:hypothetical protein